jgi:AraC-like DNA-binding protein
MTPTVNFASRASTEYESVWGPRLIPDFQFVYIVSGRAVLSIGNERLQAEAGQFLFYGPDVPHRLIAEALTHYFSLHFQWDGHPPYPVHPAPGLRTAVLDETCALPGYRLTADGYGELAIPVHFSVQGVEPLLMRIVNEYRQERPGYPYVLRALLMELLASVIRQLADRREEAELASKIAPAVAAMSDQPGKNWSVAELAQLCGYHPSYFTDIFRQEIGKNPKSYLIEQRIRLAKQALLRGEKLETLAEKLGYTSVHYLSNQFKKETGLTPGQYRLTGTQEGRKNEP